MLGSSKLWGPQQLPHSWHSRAGGGGPRSARAASVEFEGEFLVVFRLIRKRHWRRWQRLFVRSILLGRDWRGRRRRRRNNLLGRDWRGGWRRRRGSIILGGRPRA